MVDLADIALEFRTKGRDLRIASKYPRLIKRFLNENGVNYVSIIHASGGLEAAPIMGYADVIADITATGTTLRENDLRVLVDGVVIESQSVIVGNGRVLSNNPDKLVIISQILDKVDASLRSREYERATGSSTTTPQDRQSSFDQLADNLKAFDGLGGQV
jgi:ATP phosphoribosyltransferase